MPPFVTAGHRHVFICLAAAGLAMADAARAETDRGVLRVEFLYSIEHAAGRSERLREPIDVSVDRKTGELYVVDAGAKKILVYDRNGIFQQAIAVDGKEGAPRMAAVDGQGRIYVGHLNSTKITLLDFRGEFLGTLSLPGMVDVPGADVRPASLATGAAGEVYALKTAGGVVKIDPEGESHEEVAITAEPKPNVIYGMAVDPGGRFLFTDMRPYSVVVFDRKKGESRRFGSPGILHGQLDRPIGITADGAGHVFVVSTVTNKVSCFGQDGEFIEEFGGIGEGYGRFYMPTGIASDGKDRIYVLENALKRVQVFRVDFVKEKEVMRSSQETARPGGSS